MTELEENLIALGFEHGSASDQFTYGTEADVKAWQASLGEAENGVVALGDVVVEPGPIEVDTVPVSTGAAASPGTAVLTATSTTREVTIDLDADQQSEESWETRRASPAGQRCHAWHRLLGRHRCRPRRRALRRRQVVARPRRSPSR